MASTGRQSYKVRNPTSLFRMTIMEDPEEHPHMVLPEEMGDFIADTGLHSLYIIGENNEKHRCWFAFETEMWPFPVTFESGWPEVCAINNLTVGDRICFSVTNVYSNHAMYLTKEG